MAYKYVTNNNLYEIQTYMYSEYKGMAFIKEYLDSRWNFCRSLQMNTAKDISNNVNTEDNPVKRDLKKILYILKSKKYNKDIIDEVNSYTKSFEVRKKIYTGYDIQRKPLEGVGFEDYESYLLFADCMYFMYCNTKCLKYFNCLLKINDTLLSVQDKLDYLSKEYFGRIIKQELDIFYQLLDENGMSWEAVE